MLFGDDLVKVFVARTDLQGPTGQLAISRVMGSIRLPKLLTMSVQMLFVWTGQKRRLLENLQWTMTRSALFWISGRARTARSAT